MENDRPNPPYGGLASFPDVARIQSRKSMRTNYPNNTPSISLVDFSFHGKTKTYNLFGRFITSSPMHMHWLTTPLRLGGVNLVLSVSFYDPFEL